MKIKSIHIENFKSIKKLDINFPDNNLLILTGHNNAGKSNIVRAIDLICGETWKKANDLNNNDYYLRDTTQNIKIKLLFDNGRVAIFDNSLKDKKGHQDKWCIKYYANQYQNTMIYDTNIKDDFPCIYLGADRDFEKQTSFFNYSLLGKIKKEFNKKAKSQEEKLKNNFEELNQIYEEVEGFKEFKEKFSNYFQSMQADAPVKLELDFKCFTPNNYFSNINILAKDPDQDNDYTLDLSELGEGSKNIALISLLRSYADAFKGESGILILEEPELFLHPQARRHLFSELKELTKSGFQVILSTHSNSFIETELFESIGQVFKVKDEENENKTNTKLILNKKEDFVDFCINNGVQSNKVNKNNICEFYSLVPDSKITEGFFARIIILTEGDTEEYCLPLFLKHAGFNCNLNNISILGVSGKNQLPKYWRLFNQFNAPVICCFDNDQTPEKDKSNRNIILCFNETENNIFFNDVHFKFIDDKIAIGNNEIKKRLLIFKHDYETALKEDFKNYCKKNNINDNNIIENYNIEARDLIRPIGNQNKAQIARYIAKKLILNYPAYTPSFILELKEMLEKIINENETNYSYKVNN